MMANIPWVTRRGRTSDIGILAILKVMGEGKKRIYKIAAVQRAYKIRRKEGIR